MDANGRGRRVILLTWVAVGLMAAMGHAGHDPPAPSLPPGHGGVLVRLARSPEGIAASADGPAVVEAVELRRAGRDAAGTWVSLSVFRREFTGQDLASGGVWVAAGAVGAGEFDGVRLSAAARSAVPTRFRVVSGEWIIVTVEVSLVAGPAGAPPRLEVRRARAPATP